MEDLPKINKHEEVEDVLKEKPKRKIRSISPLSKAGRKNITFGESTVNNEAKQKSKEPANSRVEPWGCLSDYSPCSRRPSEKNLTAFNRKNIKSVLSNDRKFMKSSSPAASLKDLSHSVNMSVNSFSDTESMKSDVSYRRKLSTSKYPRETAHRENEKWSIQYVRFLISRNEDQFIKILRDYESEFHNFFGSQIRLKHMNTVVDLILKICSIDLEFPKKDLLCDILSSEPFIQNLSTFIDKVIELFRIENEIVICMKQLSKLFSKILDYIPRDKLLIFNSMVSKASDITRGIDDLPSGLVESFYNCSDLISKRIQNFEDDFVSYKSLSVFPTMKEVKYDHLLNIKNIEVGAYENVAQYIDIQFKLLKEDYIYSVRAGMKQYLHDLKTKTRSFNHDVFVYKEVLYDGISVDLNPMKKILNVFILDGVPLRKVNWGTTKRLIHGSLLYFSDDNFKSFFLGVLDNVEHTDSEELFLFVALVGTPLKLERSSTYVMIESRVLFEPYFQVCSSLKDMHPQLFPMSKYVIFGETSSKPPKYLKRNSRIVIDGYEVSLNDKNSWPEAGKIGLNQLQLEVIQAALTRELVVIQGPPATGKTFLAIKLINILLDNAELWNDWLWKSPIFIASYRNCAVDQILDSLALRKNNQVRRVVRLGNRTSSELMKNCTLKNVMGHRRDNTMFLELSELKDDLLKIKQKVCELEKSKLFVLNKEGILNHDLFTNIFNEKQKNFFALNSFENWLLIDEEYEDFSFDGEEDFINSLFNEIPNKRKNIGDEEFLSEDNPFVLISIRDLVSDLISIQNVLSHMQESADSMDMHEFTDLIILYNSKQNTLRKVVERLEIDDPKADVAELSLADLDSLHIEERWALYNLWAHLFSELCDSVIGELIESYDVKLTDFLSKRNVNDGMNLRCAEVDVVGATTTCAARLNKLLSVMKPKIVIIEEAAEVLEAHTIASLTEHCEHLILIGDHKQLKPSPASHISCTKYHMDISLFERMILNGMEYFSLTEQHRMRPEICSLVCPYIYKNLTNHLSVEKYPDLKGFQKNMFFLDHKVSEDQLIDSDSHQNEYEANLALHIASYIVKQGYEKNKITILTVYVAQLLYMKSIRHEFPLLDDVEMQVVDNFQGKENDIIVLSLVRSNSQTIGFLSQENRVCVAVSRAKQGFIMIGNMETLQLHSEVWKEMRKVLVKNCSIDTYLPLKCETHKNITKVKTKEDFIPLAHGGCKEECGLKLECGHICDYICHPLDTDHVKDFPCLKPCKRKQNCTIHDCEAACGVKCPPCNAKIPELLACGHDGFRICGGEILKCVTPCPTVLECGHACPRKCHMDDDHNRIKCTTMKNFILDCSHTVQAECGTDKNYLKCDVTAGKLLLCGHIANVKCGNPNPKCTVGVDITDICGHPTQVPCFDAQNKCSKASFPGSKTCKNPCNGILPCNHECSGTCGECMQGRIHVACNAICGEILICGHKCSSKCWDDFHTCIAKCMNSCVHKSCSRNCGEICEKCMMPCKWVCQHYKCTKVCWEPCNRPQCPFPCPLTLPCNHPCFGFCGEPCPPLCLFCSPDDTKPIMERYILLEDCGHTFSQSTLSDLLEKAVGLLRCPLCLTPVVKTNYVRSYTKAFFRTFSKVKSSAAALYNNQRVVIDDFSSTFKYLNEVLKNPYESCDSLNHLLMHLLMKISSIMKYKKKNETKPCFKTLLFICFYITDTLKSTEIVKDTKNGDPIVKNPDLTFINYLASYLFSRAKNNKISPTEMFQFAQELDRLNCIKDLGFLKDEQRNSLGTDIELKDENDSFDSLFTLKEFSKEDKIKVTTNLIAMKRSLNSKYHLSSVVPISNKIIEFFNKYYPISFHTKNWEKCENKHNFFLRNSINVCPLCSNETNNSLYYG